MNSTFALELPDVAEGEEVLGVLVAQTNLTDEDARVHRIADALGAGRPGATDDEYGRQHAGREKQTQFPHFGPPRSSSCCFLN